jgi:enamine deaminase RidA (YjgF/YER057c/UK114 family)
MLDVGVEPLVSLGKPMVPSWACELAPSVVESRVVPLAEGANAGLEFARGDEAGMVTAVVPGAARLSKDGLRSAVAEVFTSVLEGLRESGFAYPVRMWNFVPGIHDAMGDGVDRYRVFNMGRYDAFAKWFAGRGGAAAFARVLPAASAVGHWGEHFVVCALGARTPGVPIENPRQTPAFGYSRAHGPLPPCFARATVAKLPMGTRLLVSGTASIRGEDSVHTGSLTAQLDETFTNLDRLVRSVEGDGRFELSGIESARVYFPRAGDRAALAAGVSARLPETAAVEFFPASVCRAELLVEIEAMVAPVEL